ncbi:MAG: hypothetical protein RLZZ383_1159, partial [Pseudomonadota bacterium]
MRSWQALWALSAVACGVVAYPKGDLGPADSAVGETDPPVEDTPLDSPSDTPADTPLDSPSDTPLDTPPDTDPPQETGSGTGSGGGPAPRDDDGDGAPASGDCDDGDADVFPGATELCNAVDDDCDGGVDEGLISDGAGCLDAGPPTFPATASILHVITHTGTSTYDDSDTVQISLCLDATRCWSLGNPNWNDWELGNADVKVVEGINLARSAVNRVQLRLDGGGSDAWDPDCVQVVLDGEVIHASDPGVVFGDGAGEVSSWTSPGGPTVSRTTCHPSRLTHGPYPGAVGAYDARLWFRTDATRRTELRVVPLGASLSTAPVVAVRYPAAAQDFAEVVSVYGLQPNTAYAYRVTADGAAAEDGVFRTAPTGASQFRFAFGSCAKEDAQPIFGMIAGLDPDVFLFVGDNHYGNTNDLSDLRQFYRWAHERPERRAMMRNRANVAVWDDHDYVGNNTTGSSSGKDRALRAFGEYWANPSYGLATTPGIFSTWDWGDVRFFLLDDRYWRGLDDNILGNAQTTWLKDQLRASNATFNVLVDGSVWTPEKTGDGWGDYPAAVDDLLAFVRDEGIEGVVFLSGDVHRSELRRVAGAPGGYTVPELISSPLANSNSACEDANSHVTCGDSDDYVIAVDVDTTLADPCMTATLYGSAGNVVKTWTFCASSLRNPSPPSRAPRPDYDADGYADLVIGVPDEDVGSVVDAGAVQVFYGGTDGASPLDETLFDQDSTGFLGDPETSDRLGKVVASGDFDADGFDDLALGVPDENIGSDTNSGFVEVLYGGPSGLSTAGMQQFFQGTAGLGGATEVDDAFGAALAVGDFDGDGYDDLAVGVPGEDGAGLVEVLFGGPGGLAVSGYQ